VSKIIKRLKNQITMSATQQNQIAELTEGVNKIALRIAHDYLKAHPREYSYTIKVSYENVIDNDAIAIYVRLNENELEVLKEWMESEEREDNYITLEEYLETTGHNDVLGQLLSLTEDSSYGKSYIEDCDLDDKLQFTTFRAIIIDNEGNKKDTHYSYVALTDEEFCAILAMHLDCKYLTFNMFTYLKPTLATRIIKHINNCSIDWSYNRYPTPFAVFMDEFKNIAQSIMDEDKDILGIFKSEDPEIRKFAEENKIRND
jgi:hypothetical protein